MADTETHSIMHSSYLQRFFWTNAQFGTLRKMPELVDFDIRNDVSFFLFLPCFPCIAVYSPSS